jgi:hypothetical protein
MYTRIIGIIHYNRTTTTVIDEIKSDTNRVLGKNNKMYVCIIIFTITRQRRMY